MPCLPVRPGAPSFLGDLTEQTGGRLFKLESTRSLSAVFLEVLDEFRQRYLLSYSPSRCVEGGVAHADGAREGPEHHGPGAAGLSGRAVALELAWLRKLMRSPGRVRSRRGGRCAAAGPARAQAPGPHGWQSLRVPGGTAALLKAAGLDESLPRTRALRDVIHVIYDTQPGVNDAIDARRRNVMTYLEAISAVEALGLERGQAPPSLRQAEDRAVRRRIEAIADVIGCTLERESRTYRLQPDQGDRQTRRRADLASAGLDIDALVKAANAGQPLTVSLEADDAPLPLAPEAWTSFVKVSDKLSGSLATAILGDRAASLLYFGLLGTDAATREFFQQNTDLLRDIVASDRAAVFADHAAGIRVAGGRVAVPGGPAAEPLWQDLAGESAGRPDRFILKLFDKDGGRLASLFDAVHALDSRHQAFVLGSWIAKPRCPRGPLQSPLRRVRPAARVVGPGGEAVRQAPLRRCTHADCDGRRSNRPGHGTDVGAALAQSVRRSRDPLGPGRRSRQSRERRSRRCRVASRGAGRRGPIVRRAPEPGRGLAVRAARVQRRAAHVASRRVRHAARVLAVRRPPLFAGADGRRRPEGVRGGREAGRPAVAH